MIITLPYEAGMESNYKGSLKFITCGPGFSNRIIFDLIVVPYLIFRHKPKLIISLANYFINIYKVPSKVLVRYPYLLEETNLKFLSKKDLLIAKMRKLYFNLTITRSTHIYLQTEYYQTLFIKRYPHLQEKCSILPNPISPVIENFKIQEYEKPNCSIIYPSRYYPHKNHEFLIELCEKYSTSFEENRILFITTLDETDPKVQHLLTKINSPGISSVIKNIGEVSQQSLLQYFNQSIAIFFPSQAETFGNSLIEGLWLKLPVIVPDLPYAKTVLADAGVYYSNQNYKSAFDTIIRLKNDSKYYKEIQEKSTHQSKFYPTEKVWLRELTSMI